MSSYSISQIIHVWVFVCSQECWLWLCPKLHLASPYSKCFWWCRLCAILLEPKLSVTISLMWCSLCSLQWTQKIMLPMMYYENSKPTLLCVNALTLFSGVIYFQCFYRVTCHVRSLFTKKIGIEFNTTTGVQKIIMPFAQSFPLWQGPGPNCSIIWLSEICYNFNDRKIQWFWGSLLMVLKYFCCD